MENASKALLIAGEVLVAVLIISLGVYIISTTSGVSIEYEDSQVTAAILNFNTQFDQYLNEKLTTQEVVSLINIAKNSGYDIEVFVDNINYTSKSDSELIEFIKNNTENNTTMIKYKCEDINYSSQNHIVNKVKFKKVESRRIK